MNKINCISALMAMSAELDGEKSEISVEQVSFHLTTCNDCRQEFEQMQNLDSLFKRQKRREQIVDLWSVIENRIVAQTASQTNWKPFLLLGVFLIAYKLVERLSTLDFGWSLKLVPLIFVVALFGFLKENPFKINTELALER
ncbi:MAG: hypothetical protein M3521_12240 [Acidobacteriota bacterium]|nr:hypothetical protein [Acidobacteriota bacterium]MDQ3374641.1 hypothetical protein [Acidobacteriota bacterium]